MRISVGLPDTMRSPRWKSRWDTHRNRLRINAYQGLIEIAINLLSRMIPENCYITMAVRGGTVSLMMARDK